MTLQVLIPTGFCHFGAAHQSLTIMSRNSWSGYSLRGTRFVHIHRIRKACFGSLLAAVALFAALGTHPAVAQTPYDGTWNVTIVTKSGSCEPTVRSTLTVTDGKISAPGSDVAGTIGREGLVRVSINGAYANGQLNGNAGWGKWNGASAGVPCSGRWEASRQ
jgi:hypothetical protein